MPSFLHRVLGQFGVHPQPRVRGIPVELVNPRPDIASSDVMERLDEALGLIERYQPLRFRHFVRDVRRIRVERYACRGAFIPSEGTVITELTFLARRDITAAPVASSILHEGVHARVHAFREHLTRAGLSAGHAGVDYADGAMAREERLCRRAELAFGLSLPPALGAPVIERARATLDLADHDVAPVIDWNVARERQQQVDNDRPSSGDP